MYVENLFGVNTRTTIKIFIQEKTYRLRVRSSTELQNYFSFFGGGGEVLQCTKFITVKHIS